MRPAGAGVGEAPLADFGDGLPAPEFSLQKECYTHLSVPVSQPGIEPGPTLRHIRSRKDAQPRSSDSYEPHIICIMW